jgi:hypothetical protein
LFCFSISTKGLMYFMVFTESFDAQVMCRFLARLTGHFDRKVHLVVDRHSAHRSKAVRDRLADYKDQVELRFLPSDSPELNRDELVNADFKCSLPHTHRAKNQAELARRDPQVLPPPTTPAPYRARVLRRPARPLHPRGVNPTSF